MQARHRVCFDRHMDPEAVRNAFDEQVRRHPAIVAPGEHVERDDRVVRFICEGDGWTGVTWCDLDEASADGVIASQIERFAELSRAWEWKHYSCDRPADLPDRLRAAGFTPEPREALLVGETDALPTAVRWPTASRNRPTMAFAICRPTPSQTANLSSSAWASSNSVQQPHLYTETTSPEAHRQTAR
ncbi:MAG: hypothetical protein ACLP0J_08865 [Solirubrobacteraceae bacterium]